jgi:Flp pilus assembly protein TadD
MSPIDETHRDMTMQPASAFGDDRIQPLREVLFACRLVKCIANLLQRFHTGERPLYELRIGGSRFLPGYDFMLSGALVFAYLSFGVLPLLLSQTATGSETTNRERVRELLDQGQSLAAEGRLAEAEAPLVEAKSIAPEDFETLTILAKVQVRIGKSAEAIALFRKTAHLYPQTSDSHLNLGIALADAGQLEEALQETSRAASLAPTMASAHLNRGRILYDLHRIDEARSEFTIAHRLAPANPDCLFFWALVERASGNIVKETELLQKLVTLQPDNYKAAYSLGRSLQEQSRDSEAISALRRALAIKPDYEDAVYLLSRELRKTAPEESKRLSEEFQAARQKQSTSDTSKSLGNEAYVAAIKQNWPEAIRLLRKGLNICDLCEASAALHKNLGLALCRNGDINEGRAELKTSLKLNPNDPDVVKALDIVGR